MFYNNSTIVTLKTTTYENAHVPLYNKRAKNTFDQYFGLGF
jgi:hypothetical protein